MANHDYLSWLMTSATPSVLQLCVKEARKCLRESKDRQLFAFSYIDTMLTYVCDNEVDVDQHLFLIYATLCVNLDFVNYVHSRGVPSHRLSVFVRMCQSTLQHLMCGHEVSFLFLQSNPKSKKVTCFRHAVSELRTAYHMMCPL